MRPGGGCDEGETPAQAAGRELAEETGIRAHFDDDEPVSVERAVFPFGGRLYDQIDYFFPLRVAEQPVIDETGLNDRERAMTVEYRWWSAEELRHTFERYWPFDLVDLLERFVRSDGVGLTRVGSATANSGQRLPGRAPGAAGGRRAVGLRGGALAKRVHGRSRRR